MKKITLTILAAMMIMGLVAQAEVEKDTLWTSTGLSSLNISQLALHNWAACGDNSVSENALFKISADYNTGKLNWDNDLTLGYGLIKQGDDPTRKSDDQINQSSKLGLKANEKWLYTALFSFKTQFAIDYDIKFENEITGEQSDERVQLKELFGIGLTYNF